MKKKFFTGLFAVAMVLSLAACGNSTAPEAANEELAAVQTQVQELQDKAAIRELVDEFSNLADEKDADSQALLFTEDAQVVISFGGQENVIEGRDQIAQVFGGVVNSMDALYHMNGQVSIDLNGDTATGTVYCRVALINSADGTATLTDEAVTYQDEYVKQDGQWLISRRVSDFVFTDGHEMAAAPNE